MAGTLRAGRFGAVAATGAFFNGGAGVSFGLGRAVDLFVESRFISANWDAQLSYVPVIAGLTWSLGAR